MVLKEDNMSDNGEPKKEVTNEPKVIIKIILNPDGSFEMKSALQPPMVNWIFDRIKQDILSRENEPKKIIQAPSGGIMNFARRFKK